MSSYSTSILQWSSEILKCYDQISDHFRDEESERLTAWKERFFKFHQKLAKHQLEDIVIYEQANKLFNEFTAILEDNHLSITFEESRNHPYNKSVPIGIGKHSLPPLPYPYDALEPYISEEIMRLHHQKHHQTYVEGLNKSERELQRARQTNNFDLIKHWERELAFHGAGHYLHTIFWNNMSPKGGGMPSGELLTMMEESFGSFRQFKEHFSQAANQVEGSGWAILVWSPRARRLEVLSAEKHQNLSQWDVIPLLALDVWEHAYYLQYKNERKKYIDNWWKIVYWPYVERRFNKARQIVWYPY